MLFTFNTFSLLRRNKFTQTSKQLFSFFITEELKYVNLAALL